MPLTDLVPCFYTGQIRLIQRPAELRPRAELHKMKAWKLGKFVDNGKAFLFFKRIEQAAVNLWNGPLGIGNLIPFARLHNYGDKLHYWIGPKGMKRHGLYHRRDEKGAMRIHDHKIYVSSRNLFSRQPIPAVPLAV